MAVLIRIPWLAALVIADREEEISALIDSPNLHRDLVARGTLANRIIVASFLRRFQRHGKLPLPVRARDDGERRAGQAALFAKLDSHAASAAWPNAPLGVVAEHVKSGRRRRDAMAALTYLAALPFIPEAMRAAKNGDAADGAWRSIGRKLYRQFVVIDRCNSAASPFGLLLRLTGARARAGRAIAALLGPDPYAHHAIAVTLASSREVLANMRAANSAVDSRKQRRSGALAWAAVRTAPSVVLRQTRSDVTLPFVASRVPAHAIVLLRMRAGLKADTPSGFEFAANSWSACPARRYLIALFAAIASTVPTLDVRDRLDEAAGT